MNWRTQLRRTLQLQVVDRRIAALTMERRQLMTDEPTLSLQRAIRTEQQQWEQISAEWEKLLRHQRVLELEHQGKVEERDRSVQRLYGGSVHNARDLEGLQKNIAGAEARIGELETLILEVMERRDALSDQRSKLERSLARNRAALEQRNKEVQRRLGEVDGQLPSLQVDREEHARQIDVTVLREYERMRGGLGGVVVAKVSESACGACGVELSAMVLNTLRHGEDLVRCEHCGRLLLDEP